MDTPPIPPQKFEMMPGTGKFESVGYAPTLVQTTDGFVALLDVLGFRAIIAGDRENRVVLKYLQTIQAALAESTVETIVFSDSIVLTKSGSSPDDLHALVVACSGLMGALLSKDIPIRGAISHGSFVRSQVKSSAFLAGSPVVEAYDYEQRQDWAGVLLTPSTLRQAKEIDFPRICTTSLVGDDGFPTIEQELKWKAYVQRASIVFKGGGPMHDGFAIVPCGVRSLPKLASNLTEVLERLEWLKLLAPSPAEQSKYANVAAWLKTIRDTWQSRATDYERWVAANRGSSSP
jgi:hypothetical protein